MNLKVLIIGAILELGYLGYLVMRSMPKLPEIDVSPMFLEFMKHAWFQAIVLVIILIGAFLNGSKKDKK